MIVNIFKIVSDSFNDDGQGSNETSYYYDLYEFGKGGQVKAKEIIMNKIGYSEEAADYFIEKSEKFAVWLADSILKEEINNKNYNKKQWLDSHYSSVRVINANYGNAIREILDWLQHPITPKQELRQLSFQQALEKAREWHEELKVLGGDIDYNEPSENLILKRYPKNNEGTEYYWVYIPSNYCGIESSRMGHCGRTGYGNRLISLRSVKPYGKGHTISDSHVTIAYGGDGFFYQVKGKKNQKPAEKYFPYIFDLIKSIIQGNLESNIEIDNVKTNIKKIESDIDKIANLKDVSREFIEVTFDKLRKLKKELEAKAINFEFSGFGQEYGHSEDYGYGDMSKEEMKELYELKSELFGDSDSMFMLEEKGVIGIDEVKEKYESNPEKFSTFLAKTKLFDLGILKEKPNTKFIIDESCTNITNIIDVDRDYSDSIIENLLCGDIGELTDSWGYHYENAADLVSDLNDENEKLVIDKIVEITGLGFDEVKENGIEYYLNNEDENFSDDDFDNIKRSLARAASGGDESDYYRRLYEELKSELGFYGKVLSLNDEGVKIESDLRDFLSDKEISEYSEYLDNNERIFSEAISNGDIDKPTFSPDDRYVGSYSNKDFNEYFEIEEYKQGGILENEKSINKLVGGFVHLYSLGVQKPSLYVIKDVSLSNSNNKNGHLLLRFNRATEEKIPNEKIRNFIAGKEIQLNDTKGEPYILQLIK